MRLQHLHILRPIPYPVASRIQDAVVRRHIDVGLARKRKPWIAQNIPPPFLLTFQATPTYTCGRREIPSISPKRVKYLQANGNADFYPALRGGQTTFHGPGQLTAYLITTLSDHELTPRCYVRFLEKAIIEVCARYCVPTRTTNNPGVWLAEPAGISRLCETIERPSDSKICAVGVHMRRGVTSHGLGLNVHTNLDWFERITACGLEDKRATSFEEVGVHGVSVREIAFLFSEVIARDLERVEGINAVELAGSADQPLGNSPLSNGEGRTGRVGPSNHILNLSL